MKDIKNIKCDNCGAHLSLDENLKTLTCPYCGTVKYFDEAKNNPAEQLYKEELVVESVTDNTYTPPRPKVHIILAIILFCTYFWPGVIYLCFVHHQQKKWDEKYKNKK